MAVENVTEEVVEETPETVAAEDKGKNAEPTVKKAYADRLLKEKKALDDENKALKAANELREADEAKARGEHEKIANTERKKREEAETKLEQTRQKNRDRHFKNELRLQATKQGILDDDDVDLIDRSSAEWDEDDEPLNAAELVKKFKELKPAKFKSEEVEEIVPKKALGVNPRTNTNSKQEKVDAYKMSDEEFQKEWSKSSRNRV